MTDHSDKNLRDLLYVVIMAGGQGTRFWPASRSHRPKQFLNIVGEDSMIRQTCDRVVESIPPEQIFVVTGSDHVGSVKSHLPEVPRENILLEPVGRNTAPCIAWAAAVIREREPEAIMAILASDHAIDPPDAFMEQILAAAQLAEKTRRIVTLGIPPDRPETGYGYLQMGQVLGDINAHSYSEVRRFIEKPDQLTAARYLEEGGYLWNSGMFVFKAEKMLKEMEQHQPEILEGILEIVEAGNVDQVVQRVFPELPAVSIDFGVMEKTSGILGMPVSFDWSDVGNWQTMYEHIEPDEHGNCVQGSSLLENCKDVLTWSKDRMIVGIGLKGLIIVETDDAILVCKKDQAQKVGDMVKKLRKSPEGKRFV